MRKKRGPTRQCIDCGMPCWHQRCGVCANIARIPPFTSLLGEQEIELRRRWARGDAVKDIAFGFGVTKNVVIGKARRLGLGLHPNAGPPQSHRWPRKAMPGPYPCETIGPNDCRWPIGHPDKPDFRFCGEPAVPGRSYCAKHAAVAYVRPKEMAEAAD